MRILGTGHTLIDSAVNFVAMSPEQCNVGSAQVLI